MRQYIGARYVPRFSDVNNGIWSNVYSYEPLTIVKNGNDYYTSKQSVPVGVAITDTEYWVKTGDYNGAIVTLNNKIDGVETELDNKIDGVETELNNKIDDIIDDSIYVNVKNYGAIGDGTTDDTIAIQMAIDYAHNNGVNKVYVPSGVYMIKCHDEDFDYSSGYVPVGWNDPSRHYGLTLYSNIELFLSKGATLKSISHNRPESCMIRAAECDNIWIHGGTIIGEKTTHVNSGISGWSTDEWNVGIMLGWCNQCVIEDIDISNFTGHGLYIGAKYSPDVLTYTYTDYKSRNNIVRGCYIHDNRQVGFQLSHGIGHKIIENTIVANKDSSSPYGGGLSIEGESYGTLGTYEYVHGCIVSDNLLINNLGFGLSLSDCHEIIISDNIMLQQNDSIILYRGAKNITISNNRIEARTVYGGIVINDNDCRDIIFNNNYVANANIRMYHGTQTTDTSIVDITIKNNVFSDGFVMDSSQVDLSYFYFEHNFIQYNESLDGHFTFKNISIFRINNNTFSTDRNKAIDCINGTSLVNGKIESNTILVCGRGWLDIATVSRCNIKNNRFNNYNATQTKTLMVFTMCDLVTVENNVLVPTVSHDVRGLLYVSDSGKMLIINNVALGYSGDFKIPALININGTNKCAYANKASSDICNQVISGTNLDLIDSSVTNSLF